MFDDTLNSSWDERSRRGLTALTSFGVQALAVGLLLILPLLRPTGLPLFRALSTPVSLGSRLGEAPAVRVPAAANTVAPSNPAVLILRPSRPFAISMPASTDDGPPAVEPSGPYVPGTGPGSPEGVRGALGTLPQPIMPVAPAPMVALVRISHMSE